MAESLREDIEKEVISMVGIHSIRSGGAGVFSIVKSKEEVADQILTLIIERVERIKEPEWHKDWGGESGKAGWDEAIQAVIKELSCEQRTETTED